MSTRLKASSFSTIAEFTDAVDRIAELQVKLRSAEARRDAEIQTVRDRHEPSVEKIGGELQSLLVLAEKFAETRRAELFPTVKKSADTALACFGFRIGNPTLKLLNRKWSWESVLEAVKRSFPGQFVRLSEAVDKDALKVQLTDEQRAEVGCRIDQVETFFVEAKDQATKEAA